MKRMSGLCFALIAALLLVSGPASANCLATIKLINNTKDKTINPLSCSTQKRGKDKWIVNLMCSTYAADGATDVAKPNQYIKEKIWTTRRPKAQFRFKFTYKFVGESAVYSVVSNYSSCKDKGHVMRVSG